MFVTTPTTKSRPKTASTFGILLVCVLSTGCQSLDYRQMAYSALRLEDCQRNEVTIYCSHSDFNHEYSEYERLRTEFLKGSNEIASALERQVLRDPNKTEDSHTTTEPMLLWETTLETSTEL